jgi:hypothetical protein
MNKKFLILRAAISFVVFFIVAYYFIDFIKVDDCLDHGGRINEITNECETKESYVPLMQRVEMQFWIYVLLISIVPSLFVYWLIGKFGVNEKNTT